MCVELVLKLEIIVDLLDTGSHARHGCWKGCGFDTV